MADHGDVTDLSKGWSTLTVRWDRRAGMAGDWLSEATSVADIGCGTMALRDYLQPGTRYVGIDIAKRDDATLVVDLDKAALPDTGAEAAAVLGVIEYLSSVDDFLTQLNAFDYAVISYNHKSLKDLLWTLRIRQKRVSWANHLSARTFRRRIADAGLVTVRSKRIRLGETLYHVRSGKR